MIIVIEVLDEDGSDSTLTADRTFLVEQARLMEEDRQADGYINLDGTNYVMPVRIVGVVEEKYDALVPYLTGTVK